MKKFKRALALVLAVAMLLTSAPSFAAKTNFSDVGSKYATAVSRLTSIDILKGYEDGTFRPEGTITRAEAAAVMVRMLGKEKLASYSAGLTQFSDMAGHWANGYVNVAASAGIVNGYPDGTFRPENQVTYAEIVTMMVRALGAGEAVGSYGVWPNNYLNFAMMEGLTDDIAVIPNAPATRGDVAVVANATLDVPVWKATGYNTDGTRTYATTKGTDDEKTLFQDKLELDKEEMAVVTGPLDVTDGDFYFTADDKKGHSLGNLYFAEGMEVPVLPGQEVDIWLNDDNEVVMLQPAKDSKQKVIDFADLKSSTSTKVEIKTLDGSTKKYDLAATTYYIVDGVDRGTGATGRGFVNADYDLMGRAILNKDNKVTHLYTYKYNNAMVVGEVDFDEDDNEYVIKADKDELYDESKLTYELDDEVVYVINARGQNLTLADIEEGDLILYTDNEQYILVLDAKVVEGTVDGIDAEEIEVDGDDYEINPNFEGNSKFVESAKIDDEVRMFLDAAGKVVLLDRSSGTKQAGDYGVIIEFYEYEDEKRKDNAKIALFDLESGVSTGLKVFNAEKTEEEGFENGTGSAIDFYDASGKQFNATDINPADYLDLVVRYQIKSDKIIIYDVEDDEIAVESGEAGAIKVNKEKITVDGKNYFVDSDTVKIYQAVEIDDDDVIKVKALKFADLKDTDSINITLVEFDDDKEYAEYVYIPLKSIADNLKYPLKKTNDDYIGVITRVRELSGDIYKISVVTQEGPMDFYMEEDEAEDITGVNGFNGSSISLTSSSDWTKFQGLLVAFSADEDNYVTSENIQFSSSIKVAKFYEVNSRDEVKLLTEANDGTKSTVDAYKDMFVLAADVNKDAKKASLTTNMTGSNNDLVITAKEAGYEGNSISIRFVDPGESDQDLSVSVTGKDIVVSLATDDSSAIISTAEEVMDEINEDSEASDLVVVTLAASNNGTGEVTELVKTKLSGGLTVDPAKLTFKSIEESSTSKIEEVDSDVDEYSEAESDKADTVYYYLVEVDDDGDLVDLDVSHKGSGNVDAIAIMIFDSSEF